MLASGIIYSFVPPEVLQGWWRACYRGGSTRCNQVCKNSPHEYGQNRWLFGSQSGGSMKIGDLIYSNHDDEYAIYLGGDSYDGWITILQDDGSTCQVQKQWWEAA